MGITQMLQALSNNDTLETLVLHTNTLEDEGAEKIAQYMAGTFYSLIFKQSVCSAILAFRDQ